MIRSAATKLICLGLYAEVRGSPLHLEAHQVIPRKIPQSSCSTPATVRLQMRSNRSSISVLT